MDREAWSPWGHKESDTAEQLNCTKLKLNIEKTKIMISSTIISLQIYGETLETVTAFIFWSSKITMDGDGSHEIFFLERKAMEKLDSILKSKDITLPTKALLVKAMVFPVVIHGCESWTIKKAVQFSSVAQSCSTLCNPMDFSTPGLLVHHQPLEFIQTYVH